MFVSSKDGSRGAMMLIGADGKILFKGYDQTGDYTPGNVTLYSVMNAGSAYFSTDHEILKNTYFNGFSVVECSIGDNVKYGILAPDGVIVFTKEPDPEYYMYGRSKYGVFYGEDGRVREDLGKYAYVYPFSDGIALTLGENGEYNYIDKNGKILFR